LLIAEASAHRIRKVSPEGVIGTVAVNGTPGFSGDGGLATTAQLNLPSGVAVDAQGNLFIADSTNRRIRKVAPDGMISTVAGNGVSGFGGDGGPAVSAMIGETLGIAVDAKGNLFIADARNQRVRQITPNGIINTLARITQAGWFGSPVGIAIDDAGNLFVVDSFFHTIWKNPQDGLNSVAGDCRLAFNSVNLNYLFPCNGGFRGDGGPATAALLNGPSGVAVDATGNLFIADSYNHRIRKVTPNGVIGTVAGNGTERFTGDDGPATAALLNNPTDVAVDTAGNLFIADSANYRIRKVTPTGIISTIVGGPAPSAAPVGIAVDAKGSLWIAESNSHRIRKVSPEGVISTVAGTGRAGFSGDDGPANSAQLNFPRGIDVDAQGNLFIADVANRRVRKVAPDGVIRTVAGNGMPGFSGDGGPATSAALGVTSVAVDAQGNLFIAGDHRIRRVTPDGVIRTVAGNGTPGFSGDGGSATSAALNGPSGIAVDAEGNIFIADTVNHRVRRVSSVPFAFTISDRGGASLRSEGMSPQMQTGYAIIESDGGRPAPSGLAIIGFRQNGVLVSEAGVAATVPIRFGRIYAEIQAALKTGLALANPNDEAAVVVYYFTDRNGTLRPGSTTIPPRGQIAAFLNESPFNGGASLSGSFTFIASVPVAVTAIRGRINERGEWLMTTMPVTDLGTPPLQQSEVLPHFSAGGGWTTEVVLVNRTDSLAKGTVRFRGPSGQSAVVRVGAATSDTFTYAVAPGASEVLRAIGATANIQTGSVVVLPEPNTIAPTGFVIFSYEDGGVITREVGVPAAAPGTVFRLYAEAIGEFGNAGSIQTALAVANPSANDTALTLELHNLNGSSTGLLGSLRVPANGQSALFLNQVPGFRPLPADFKGVLRVSATTPISVIGLRARHNERGDLLMAAMPPVREDAASASKLYFPHIVDSRGYTTELILFSANSGQAATGVLRFVSPSGVAWNLSIRPAGPTSVNGPADSNTGTPLGPRGLRLKTDKATPGYVLFSPLASDTTYLVDNDGKAVRTWMSDLLPSAWVYMKDNGHIMRGGKETNAAGIGGGGQGGRFQEFTFDGELVWDFSFNDERHLPHHDAVILPNGNVLAIVWEVKTAEDARKAGRFEGFHTGARPVAGHAR
jgi:sugar lactone lactonase YvrE